MKLKDTKLKYNNLEKIVILEKIEDYNKIGKIKRK